MKKILAMLLSATLIFSLAACGGSKTDAGAGADNADSADAVKIGVNIITKWIMKSPTR